MPSSPPPEADWVEVLAAVEEQLASTETSLDRGDEVPDVSWEAPRGAGPLPPHLASQARALLERNELVQAEIRARMARLTGELGALRHRRGALTAYVAADDPMGA
jgi:hypothetical protein